ncbi:acetate--CoA ligase family protein [Desulfogranum mediterraneum]|uniref:acetate--CoA ligase family protein n=1 Tax=Desulfogranum mediterraneum TaxID=160661 RepID=UPI000403E2D0|nr:acetate--CoA ligase family protein [Desulfogranum mediterraneum]
MSMDLDFTGISQLLATAAREGRAFLYEYEVYDLLALSGAETPPRSLFVPRGARPADPGLTVLPGEQVVLKIVSPTITHKTEVGGVRIVANQPDRIRSGMRRMLYEVPEQYSQLLERYPHWAPASYRHLRGEALEAAIRRDLSGVLLVQFMPPDSSAFGNELIVGLRHTREFGMILSAGLGGTDTELYAQRFRKGQAVVAASTVMHDGDSFFELFRTTIAYKKLAGLTRGQRRIVSDEQLIECFASFIEMANYYSPTNPEAPFILEELEINPFAFTDYLMVPLDGLCRFSLPRPQVPGRPLAKIEQLLHPRSIGIVGVSSSRRNFGRIILENVLAQGFSPEQMRIIGPSSSPIEGVVSVAELAALPERLDLLIVAVGAEQVVALVEQIIALDCARAVMLIAGGLGETAASRERAEQVIEKITAAHASGDGGPVFLGANCMGVISRPGRYDTWFIPREKLPQQSRLQVQRAVLISQSGAFMLHRSHQCPELHPAYMISMGNQTDLTLGDMVHYFKDADQVDVIAVYAEGFKDMDGLAFCQAVHAAVLAGKEVIFYKAGRTPEGKEATSGHTASLAGDYMVCESCVRQAGAVVARNFSEFQDLFFLAERLHDCTVQGNRLAAVSGAGFEAVGMADSLTSDDFQMELAEFGNDSREAIQALLAVKKLDKLVSLTNPLDINPAADDEAHAEVAAILLADPGVDALVISLDPLSPAMRTLENPDSNHYDMNAPGSIKNRLIELCGQAEKPVVAVVDGGDLYQPLRQSLIDANIPVFAVCDRAVAALSLYLQGRLAAQTLCAAEGIDGWD